MSSVVFGPIRSRRLGRSLGVDLVPFKTCTYDCIYCQLGRTTNKTTARKCWTPVDEIVAAIRERLHTQPDYITLSGSGEPTLYSRLGELVDRVKTLTNIPLAVLTNGSLLWQGEVRRQLAPADLVIPSLDAGSEVGFQIINRPCVEITFPQMLEGLLAFRRVYRGQYWLEVLLVDEMNTTEQDLSGLTRWAERIRPDRIHLNTVSRPPAESAAKPVSPEHLGGYAQRFTPRAEVIGSPAAHAAHHGPTASPAEIIEILRRRPCTLVDIAASAGLHPHEAAKCLATLLADRLIRRTVSGGQQYFSAAPPNTT